MPASSGVGIVGSHIESSIRASLGGNHSTAASLEQKLISTAKRILLHKIEFEQADSDSSFQLNNLRAKYKPLNAPTPVVSDCSPNIQMVPTPTIHKSDNDINITNGHHTKSKVLVAGVPNDGIPKPAVVLFSPENVQLEWKMLRAAGVGLRNNNNNCYLNSVLQCLTYSPPLVNYLYSKDHTHNCKQTGFCMMCELQRHVKRCLEQPRVPTYDNTISPQSILGKIKMIAKHLSYGRQEDAHEFLRYVVEAMQKSCLHGCSEKLDRFSKDTTVVNQIFGGYLRSQVMCLKCKERSNTYDPLLDISLDIKNVTSLQRAFEMFVQPETLDSDNAYNCPRCKTKVPAQKRFTVHRAPNILTVQLKRFDYNCMTGGKVTRQIVYPERLDLRSYMSLTKGPPVTYQLYAVLTHVGHSAGSGHYFCNIRAPNKQWFTMNDQHVSEIGLQRVLNTEAYLLFYCRIKPRNSNQYELHKPMGPHLPPGYKLQSKQKFSNSASELSNDAGNPISRKENGNRVDMHKASKPLQASNGSHVPRPVCEPTAIPVAAKRDKVTFDLMRPRVVEKAAMKKSEGKGPRIVMQIKHGKVFFPGDGKEGQQHVNGVEKKTKLVPYNENSSEEEDGLNIQPPGPNLSNKDKLKAGGKSHGIVFDERLNATTVVPGSYKPLNTGSNPDHSTYACGDGLSIKPVGSNGRFNNTPGRSVCESLNVVTNNGSQHRMTSTTAWHVLDPESAISPSLASGSSNTSMNSTTDWQVTPGADLKRTKCAVPDAMKQCNGWTIRAVNDGKNPNANGDSLPKAKPTQHDNSKPHNELNITIKKQPHNGTWQSKPKHSELFMDEFPDIEDKEKCTSNMNGIHATVNTSPTSTGSIKQVPNGHTQTNGSPLKQKKRKKYQMEHSDDEDNDQVNGCGAASIFGIIKKKKKKKHKHGDRERLLSTSDSDSAHTSSKRSSSSEETEDPRHKRRSEGSGSGSEHQSCGDKIQEQGKERSFQKEVPVQLWDHHVSDGYKRHSLSEQDKTKQSWDGMRSKTDVVSEMKNMSNRGYGNQVSSWDGSMSTVDKEVEHDRQSNNNKCHWAMDYESELDRGKTKKVKSSSYERFGKNKTFGQGNPFQKMADVRRSGGDRDRRPPKSNERHDRMKYGSSAQYSHGGYNSSGYIGGGYNSSGYNSGGYNGHEHGCRANYNKHTPSHYRSYSGGYHANKRQDRFNW